MKHLLYYFGILVALSLTNCKKGSKSDPEPLPVTDDYQLVWSDEFNNPGLPDPSKWSYNVGGTGWGNQEEQYYTDSRLKNAEVKDGFLTITAIKEDFEGKKYTSARLVTKSKGDWVYGKIEVRAKLPDGIGMWPAIWMLSTEQAYGTGYKSGEIDIMENVSYYPGIIFASAHCQNYNYAAGTQKTSIISIPGCYTEFHNYILEWDATEFRIYVDKAIYFTYKNEGIGFASWPFDKKFHLILNIAVGGSFGGVQGIDDNIFPRSMVIDYVRVYEKKSTSK